METKYIKADTKKSSKKVYIDTLKKMMDKLEDKERLELMSNYCSGCGTKYRPCYCLRDD